MRHLIVSCCRRLISQRFSRSRMLSSSSTRTADNPNLVRSRCSETAPSYPTFQTSDTARVLHQHKASRAAPRHSHPPVTLMGASPAATHAETESLSRHQKAHKTCTQRTKAHAHATGGAFHLGALPMESPASTRRGIGLRRPSARPRLSTRAWPSTHAKRASDRPIAASNAVKCGGYDRVIRP